MIIHSTFLKTPYGDNFWNIAARHRPEFLRKLTLLEQLRIFLETQELTIRIFCTEEVIEGLRKFDMVEGLEPFPNTMQALNDSIGEIPIWYLAGSAGSKSLIGASLMTGGEVLTSPPIHFKNRLFIAEQQMLLELIGSREVISSPIFKIPFETCL